MIAATVIAIGVNLGSMHTAGGMNNVNPGLYAVTESGYAGGLYLNSHKRVSVWAGHKWETRPAHGLSAAVVAGVITGYGKPSPLVSPSVAYRANGVTYRVSYAPKHPTKQNASDALHLSIEWSMK
jgi:hypothetical protein